MNLFANTSCVPKLIWSLTTTGYEPLNRVCLSAFVSGDVTARACDWLRDYLLHSKMIIFLLNQ